LKPKRWNDRIQEITTDNGIILNILSCQKYLIVKITTFPHRNIQT